MDFGSNEWGLHFAAGVDWMHAMLEGLGKKLIECVASVLKKRNQLTPVNKKIRELCKRTSFPGLVLKLLSNGIDSLGKVDATHIEGIVVQLGVALGNEPPVSETGTQMSRKRLRGIHRCIYLFLRLCRLRRLEEHTDSSVQVFHTT